MSPLEYTYVSHTWFWLWFFPLLKMHVYPISTRLCWQRPLAWYYAWPLWEVFWSSQLTYIYIYMYLHVDIIFHLISDRWIDEILMCQTFGRASLRQIVIIDRMDWTLGPGVQMDQYQVICLLASPKAQMHMLPKHLGQNIIVSLE